MKKFSFGMPWSSSPPLPLSSFFSSCSPLLISQEVCCSITFSLLPLFQYAGIVIHEVWHTCQLTLYWICCFIGELDMSDKNPEIYEIDYRGPETHSYIPPPNRSGGLPFIHGENPRGHRKSKGLKGGKIGENVRSL